MKKSIAPTFFYDDATSKYRETASSIIFAVMDSGAATFNAFLASASTITTVGELKDLIKAKQSPDFDDIVANKLALWHASINDNQSRLMQGDFRADSKKIANKFFEPAFQHIRFLNEFMQGAYALPVTEGSISGLSAVGERSLKKPEQPLRYYSLTCDLRLGLYFNAAPRNYGSSDMHTLIQALSECRDIYLSKNRIQNTDRIRYLTYSLLYARLLILEYCLSIAGSRDSFSCQRWMFLQVATPVFEDIFQALFQPTFQPISQYFHSHVVSSTIMNIVQERFKNVQMLLRGRTPSSAIYSNFLVVLDEL
ncbi:hypothetical protein BGZ50_008089 [Haplosporangium sp. Z 11]|nr:hypothetical protein BGZ50_008089 [Haplosporangium sp. Z 11]